MSLYLKTMDHPDSILYFLELSEVEMFTHTHDHRTLPCHLCRKEIKTGFYCRQGGYSLEPLWILCSECYSEKVVTSEDAENEFPDLFPQR